MTMLCCGGKTLDLSTTRVMGVVNVTPDSFYEKSRYQGLDRVLYAVESMIENGVDILDVGGESTRPGVSGVPDCEKELSRVLPVVEALFQRFDKVISVDTSSALVMRETAKSGAGMINDVRALHREGALEAAVESGLPVVLMHSLVEQPGPGFTPNYTDVVSEVGDYLLERANVCQKAGIDASHLIFDPGFGGGMFGKTPVYDLLLLQQLQALCCHGYPVLAGLSRKSFIGAVLNQPVEERLSASLAVAVMAVQGGARIIRVHDVKETVEAIRIADAVRRVTRDGW